MSHYLRSKILMLPHTIYWLHLEDQSEEHQVLLERLEVGKWRCCGALDR